MSSCYSDTFLFVRHEPLNSLIHLMATLTTVDGKIAVDGLDKMVAPLTDAEKEAYKTIDFDVVSNMNFGGHLLERVPQRYWLQEAGVRRA